MIDDERVTSMAREYQMNPSLARKLLEQGEGLFVMIAKRLLEQARDVPALRIGRRYRDMTGGDADGQKNIETVPGAEEGTVTD